MKTMITFLAFSFFFSVTRPVEAKPPVLRGRDMHFTHPDFPERMGKIWDFVSLELARSGSRDALPPEIHLETFTRVNQSAEWTAWQNEWIVANPSVWLAWTDVKRLDGKSPGEITPEWVREHLDTLYPFPVTFRAFHYDGTNRIQVNPDTTFLSFYQNDPYGVPRDLVGYGYYVSGHEMAHYALAQKGVPELLHHCIYLLSPNGRPNLMQRLVEFLLTEKIAGSMIGYYGYSQEVAFTPCSQLSTEDQALAAKYAAELVAP